MVHAEIDPASACLSNDSSFALVLGQAVFPGSVCLPADNVRLRFYTTSNSGLMIYSDWTPEFNVSGL